MACAWDLHVRRKETHPYSSCDANQVLSLILTSIAQLLCGSGGSGAALAARYGSVAPVTTAHAPALAMVVVVGHDATSSVQHARTYNTMARSTCAQPGLMRIARAHRVGQKARTLYNAASIHSSAVLDALLIADSAA
jgi:hypothetical protein